MNDAALTPEQEELAARIEDVMRAGAKVEIQRISRTLASKSDGELFGETDSRSATCSRSWAPGHSTPLWRSGKKGGPRIQPQVRRGVHRLSGMRRANPPHGRPPRETDESVRNDPLRTRLLPLPALPLGPLPERPTVAARKQVAHPPWRRRGTSITRPSICGSF